MKLSDIVKKGALIGLGVASLTKEKAEQMAKELEKRGELSSKDTKKLIARLKGESTKQSSRLQKMVREEIAKAIRTLDEATHKEVRKLRGKGKKK